MSASPQTPPTPPASAPPWVDELMQASVEALKASKLKYPQKAVWDRVNKRLIQLVPPTADPEHQA